MRRPSFLPSPTHTRHHSASDVPTEVLDKHPEIEELFAPLSQLLNDEKTQELYARVDVDGEDYTTVSLDFLQEENLIAE